jgi:hypothetical protein
MKGTTKPEVFIIESLDFKDEKADRCEGLIISKILAFSGKKCAYYYIRTRHELEQVLRRFSQSQYRYLHISCHGDDETMYTTLDSISFEELSPVLRPHLKNRRLFLSACSMANRKLAKLLIPSSGCYSILGPKGTIAFKDAPILWASLYHTLFSADSKVMKRHVIRTKTQAIVNMFDVQMNFIYPENGHDYGLNVMRPT